MDMTINAILSQPTFEAENDEYELSKEMNRACIFSPAARGSVLQNYRDTSALFGRETGFTMASRMIQSVRKTLDKVKEIEENPNLFPVDTWVCEQCRQLNTLEDRCECQLTFEAKVQAIREAKAARLCADLQDTEFAAGAVDLEENPPAEVFEEAVPEREGIGAVAWACLAFSIGIVLGVGLVVWNTLRPHF